MIPVAKFIGLASGSNVIFLKSYLLFSILYSSAFLRMDVCLSEPGRDLVYLELREFGCFYLTLFFSFQEASVLGGMAFHSMNLPIDYSLLLSSQLARFVHSLA